MKHVCAVLLALLLVPALSAAAEINPTNVFVGRWKDARAADAEMKILPLYLEEEGAEDLAHYPIEFTWSSAPDKQVTWKMTSRYNAEADRLEYAKGVKIEDGKKVWSDAKGYLALDKKGNLTWLDTRETDSTKLTFVRDISPAPSAEVFADRYFRVVAGLERGASGAALKAAQVVAKVLEFAKEYDLWNADGVKMQANLEAAWKSLSDGEKARFEAAFEDGLCEPVDGAFEDYAAYKGVFDDAGVGVAMARLTASPEVKLSWEYLSSATLNMGNTLSDYDGEAMG